MRGKILQVDPPRLSCSRLPLVLQEKTRCSMQSRKLPKVSYQIHGLISGERGTIRWNGSQFVDSSFEILSVRQILGTRLCALHEEQSSNNYSLHSMESQLLDTRDNYIVIFITRVFEQSKL